MKLFKKHSQSNWVQFRLKASGLRSTITLPIHRRPRQLVMFHMIHFPSVGATVVSQIPVKSSIEIVSCCVCHLMKDDGIKMLDCKACLTETYCVRYPSVLRALLDAHAVVLGVQSKALPQAVPYVRTVPSLTALKRDLNAWSKKHEPSVLMYSARAMNLYNDPQSGSHTVFGLGIRIRPNETRIEKALNDVYRVGLAPISCFESATRIALEAYMTADRTRPGYKEDTAAYICLFSRARHTHQQISHSPIPGSRPVEPTVGRAVDDESERRQPLRTNGPRQTIAVAARNEHHSSCVPRYSRKYPLFSSCGLGSASSHHSMNHSVLELDVTGRVPWNEDRRRIH